MLYFKIENIKPGMILGKDLQDSNTNMLLLRKDTVLTENHIESLKKHGYTGIYIESELFKDIVVEDVIPEKLKNETIKNLKEFDIDSIMDNAKRIVDEIISSSNISFDMLDTEDFDNSFYNHSLKVAEMSIVIGNKIGLSRKNLDELAIAALLHDYGKLCKNENIMNKIKIYKEYGNFDEYDKSKYPLYSFLLVSGFDQINATIKNIILSHNIDITSDSFSIMRNKIPIKAKRNILGDIIHVADVYDIIVRNAYSSSSYTYSQVIEYVKEATKKNIKKEYLDILLKFIPLYPVGTIVKLSNGTSAVVMKNNSEFPDRPIVKTFQNKTIDLMKVHNIVIADNNEEIKKTR